MQVEYKTLEDIKALSKEALKLATQIMRGKVPVEGMTDSQGQPVYQIVTVRLRLAAAMTILDRCAATAKVTRRMAVHDDTEASVDALTARIQERVRGNLMISYPFPLPSGATPAISG